ncbi:biliverdin-producing heme oxygenase [Brevibacterium rongguiense]|nr:biliverdin-producing heme oxygenase [Brevibacterium rongguiense]
MMTAEHTEARPDDAEAPLSTAIKTATAQAHDETENSSFMSQLMGGHLDRAAYTTLTGQLLLIYRELEAAVSAHRTDPALAPLADPALERTAALEADWAALTGGAADPSPLPATRAYIERLCGLDAPQLAAHHYTRYLGDLSGGQIIATLVQRHYGIDEGRAFYDFSHLGKLKPYKDRYRSALDSLPLTAEQRADLLAEASAAFECNRALFEDLATASAAS